MEDITERRHLDTQLRKTAQLAEVATLAAGMAHEIGTPMNVILGRAEYLLDRVSEEPIRKGLQIIVAQVDRITRVMKQLMSIARPKAPERQAVILKGVINASLEMFEERLVRRHIQIERVMENGCPFVQADPDQMAQVLINLLTNAIHAMPEGGVIRIQLRPEGEFVRLTVADTGNGIPAEVVTRIFEPFFTTKDVGKGTGLGLAIVKGIIDEHRGTIAVQSQVGKGTTFTILLPQASHEAPMWPCA